MTEAHANHELTVAGASDVQKSRAEITCRNQTLFFVGLHRSREPIDCVVPCGRTDIDCAPARVSRQAHSREVPCASRRMSLLTDRGRTEQECGSSMLSQKDAPLAQGRWTPHLPGPGVSTPHAAFRRARGPCASGAWRSRDAAPPIARRLHHSRHRQAATAAAERSCGRV